MPLASSLLGWRPSLLGTCRRPSLSLFDAGKAPDVQTWRCATCSDGTTKIHQFMQGGITHFLRDVRHDVREFGVAT